MDKDDVLDYVVGIIAGAVAVVFVCGAAYTITELFLYWGAL